MSEPDSCGPTIEPYEAAVSALEAAVTHLRQNGGDVAAVDLRLQMGAAIALDAELGASRAIRWLRGQGIDPGALWARDVALCLVPVAPIGADRFELALPSERDARLGVVIEVRDGSDETVIDLLALDAGEPAAWRLLLGRAPLLDAWSAGQPPASRGGAPLRLWRGPLGWLRAGCTGSVLLQPARAFDALGSIEGPFVAEDTEHARVLAEATAGWLERSRILVRKAAA